MKWRFNCAFGMTILILLLTTLAASGGRFVWTSGDYYLPAVGARGGSRTRIKGIQSLYPFTRSSSDQLSYPCIMSMEGRALPASEGIEPIAPNTSRIYP